jgi:hypothetical protein
MRSINLSDLVGIRNNCHRSGSHLLLYLFIKSDKIDCSNYRGLSLLAAAYKILSNILVSRLTPYIEELTADHQCGFRRNRSTRPHVLHSTDTGEKCEYNETFIDLRRPMIQSREKYCTIKVK